MSAWAPDALSAAALLRDAARRFDASPGLQSAARRAAPRGFQGGAEWMALALEELRGTPPAGPASGALRAGLVKYGAATLAASLVLSLLWPVSVLLAAAAAVLVFYAIEVQGAFVFPAIAAGVTTPWRESRGLVESGGGTAAAVGRTLVIAAVMLFGGLAGRGFLRSWCVGCLAMVLWYEAARS